MSMQFRFMKFYVLKSCLDIRFIVLKPCSMLLGFLGRIPRAHNPAHTRRLVHAWA